MDDQFAQEALGLVSEGVAVVDAASGTIVDCTPTMARLLGAREPKGRTSAELLGATAEELAARSGGEPFLLHAGGSGLLATARRSAGRPGMLLVAARPPEPGIPQGFATLEQLAQAFEGSGAPLWVRDARSVFLHVNPAGASAPPISGAPWLGRTPEDFLPEASAREIRARDTRAIKEGIPSFHVDTIDSAKGPILRGTLRLPARGPAGQPVAATVGIDLTPVLGSEPMMSHMEDRLAAVLSAIPLPLAVEDVELGELRYRNTPFDDLAAAHGGGAAAGAALLRRLAEEWDDVDGEKPQPLGEAAREVTLGPERAARRLQLRTRVSHYAGRALRTWCFADVTPLRQAERRLQATNQALGASESLLRAVFDSIPQSVVVLSPSMRIESLNHAAERQMRLVQDRPIVVGRSFVDYVPPQELEGFCESFGAALSGQHTSELCAVSDLNGRTRFFEVGYTPVRNRRGEIVNICRISLDATERAEGHREMLRQAERLRSVAELTSDFHYEIVQRRHTGEPRLAWAAGDLTAVTGYTAEELARPGGWESIVHPEDRPAWRRRVRRVLAGESRFDEYRIVSKDGATRWIRDATAPFRDGARVAGVRGGIRDITERRTALEALRASEERLRAIFDNSPIGIGLAATDGRVLTFNAAFGRLLGYTLEQGVNLNVLDVTHPEDRASTAENLRALFEGRIERYEVEKRYLRRDGTGVWGRMTVSMIRDAAGAPRYALGMFEDITERRAAADRVRLLDTAMRHSGDALVMMAWDPVRFDGLTVIYASDSYYRLAGGTAAEALGREPSFLAALRRDPVAWGPARAALMRRHPARAEFALPGPGGAESYLELNLTPVRDASGVATHCLAVLRDVSERVRAAQREQANRERLQAAQKMESIGVLAGGIAHEFNNLLSAIQGNAGLAAMALPPDSPVRPSLEKIEAASDRAAELTGQLLAYAGRGRFDVRPLDLSKVVSGVVTLVRSQRLTEADMVVDLPSALPLVQIDVARIGQVVTNLLTNSFAAVRSTPAPRITVRTGVADSTAEVLARSYARTALEPGRHVFLEIEDNGAGMPDEVRTRMFEPFYSAEAGGQGLGLAVVLGIVASHGGAIFVSSAPGRGTTIRALFPVHTGSAKAEFDSGGTPLAIPRNLHGHVLVVDGDDMARDVARACFERFGFQVLAAADAAGALDLARICKADLALAMLDLAPGAAAAAELAARLRSIVPRLPIIATSGSGPPEADAFTTVPGPKVRAIAKPFRPAQLLERVQVALSGGAE
ncbi:MAG: PAS domain S-box protein [Candidatus Sumerlaeia bacterium]|nr:PAS domain S-box protein [Candidatus Sumerlaeia bacterium]